MSKVESNDEIRIRETQEAQRRAEVRNREAQRSRMTQTSFRETLRARETRASEVAHRERTDRKQGEERSGRQVLETGQKKRPLNPLEVARRAALARAVNGKSALGRRAQESVEDGKVLADRADFHDARRLQENEQVSEVLQDSDASETACREEQREEIRREAEAAQIASDLAAERRRERRDRNQSDQDERGEPGELVVAGPGRARGARRPQAALPPEVMKRIVSTITKVVEDGRTRLRVKFQSHGLEGVELEVRAEDGQVSCSFSGCSDRLRRDLEKAEPALATALNARGLRLRALEAK